MLVYPSGLMRTGKPPANQGARAMDMDVNEYPETEITEPEPDHTHDIDRMMDEGCPNDKED